MTRVYLAASHRDLVVARAAAATLARAGYVVASRWHDHVTGNEAALTAAQRERIARANFAALATADALVALVTPACAGTLVEIGYALGRGARVVCVGSAGDATLMLAGCAWCATVEEACGVLRG